MTLQKPDTQRPDAPVGSTRLVAPARPIIALVAVLILAGSGGAIPTAVSGPLQAGIVIAGNPLVACELAYLASDLEGSRRAAEATLAIEPDSYAATWRLARVLADLGHQAEERDEQRRLFEEAERYARRAVELKPDGSMGHLYVAIAVGRLALFMGGKDKIRLGEEVRDEALLAVELDPTNDLALHVLAQWHREVASLSGFLKMAAKVMYGGVPGGASKEKAVEYFQRAIAVRPEHMHHHLELGITYMAMDRHEEAVEEFETVLRLPVANPNDPGYQQEALELLPKARKQVERS